MEVGRNSSDGPKPEGASMIYKISESHTGLHNTYYEMTHIYGFPDGLTGVNVLVVL